MINVVVIWVTRTMSPLLPLSSLMILGEPGHAEELERIGVDSIIGTRCSSAVFYASEFLVHSTTRVNITHHQAHDSQ